MTASPLAVALDILAVLREINSKLVLPGAPVETWIRELAPE
jgi:hypothetical protein